MSSPKKVLIIDADQTAAAAVGAICRQQNWEVAHARDAVFAQSLARKENPTAIVMSSHVPGGGAALIVTRIRSSVYTANIPIIVLAQPGASKKEFLAAGANEFLESGRDPNLVHSVLKKHLSEEQPLTTAMAPSEVIRDPERMAALSAAGVLDTPPDALLDSITQIASQLLEVPIALLSMVSHDRQFFKSQFGLPEPWCSARQTPLSHSFCQWVVAGTEEVVIADARREPVLKTSPAIRDLGVIAYAGIPMFSKNGPALGSFCAIDSEPRQWSERELADLRNLASMSEAALLLEKKQAGGLNTGASAILIQNTADLLARGIQQASVSETLLNIIRHQARLLSSQYRAAGA